MVWKLLLVLESEMEIFLQVHTSGNWRNYTIRVSKGAARERQPHLRLWTLLWCSWLFLAGHLWDWLKAQGAQANHWARNQAGGPNFIRWDEGGGPQATQMTSQCFSSSTKVNEMLTPTCLKRFLMRSNWERRMSNLVDRSRVNGEKKFYIFAFRPLWSWKAT